MTVLKGVRSNHDINALGFVGPEHLTAQVVLATKRDDGTRPLYFGDVQRGSATRVICHRLAE
jgi:hypothetical protein